ncbi:nucleotidyltransferase domain-containing protein [Salinigranum halophilum]|uniref:nucleotidyltransferase domain-containing protein n=1 Tax=Salinigranum halophilum TaxID=2565931 RepID=UPI0010A7728E|nr:nucleotidyltransferase family protein [Salinigranum halophilum]
MLTPATSEAEFLFRIVQYAGNPEEAKKRITEIVRTDPDWSEIARLASHHGLSSQLHQVLDTVEKGAPEWLQQELQERYQNNALNNLQYAQHLHELLETFDEHNIRAIPYKGPVLAEYAYGSLDRRWFGDLDFIVAKEDILRARKLLLRRGYRQTNAQGISPSSLVEGSVFRWEQEFRFIKDDLRVELRYQLAGGEQASSQTFSDLWKNRVSLTIAGRPLHGLSPENRALLLLRHGTKHGWCRLSWVYDMGLVMQQEIRWKDVLSRAEQCGWTAAVLLGLAVTVEFADVTAPWSVRREISTNIRADWGASVLKTLFRRDPSGEAVDVDPLTLILFLNDTWEGSVRELVDVVFSPSIATYELLPLRPSLYPLYYFLRPVELILKLT